MKIFPEGFVWGTATAACQIEGGATDKDDSIWDAFCNTAGAVKNGDHARVTCDHYNRMEEDLDLMAELGAQAYRFSIAWPRLIFNGVGDVNEKGVKFYRDLIAGLKARGIKPYVTLYHWDLPACLGEQGGWTNREVLSWFDYYTDVVIAQLGDVLENVIVLNEPSVVACVGHLEGVHAPGIKCLDSFYRTVHHLNMCHGATVQKFKSRCPHVTIGSTFTHFMIEGASDSPEDQHAAIVMRDAWSLCYLDPIVHGQYPETFIEPMAKIMQPGDMAVIHQAGDFIGMNHYCSDVAIADERELIGARLEIAHNSLEDNARPTTDLGWPIIPEGIYHALVDLKERYGDIPLIITENGCSFNDVLEGTDRVCDTKRIEYLESYLAQVHRAITDGVDVRGYFVWSLMDNFEWAEGFSPRFGLLYVDYDDGLRRVKKDSFHWYKALVESNSIGHQ